MSDHVADLTKRRAERFSEQQGIGPVKSVPDRELIATLVALGQPMWSARQDVAQPHGRLNALRVWNDVQEANEGDPEARMRLDYIRKGFQQLRKEELIADDPRRAHGHVPNPGELDL